METPQPENTQDLSYWYTQLKEIVDYIEKNEEAEKTATTTPPIEISDSETSFTSLTTLHQPEPTSTLPVRSRGKDISLLTKKKRIRKKNPNVKTRKSRRGAENGNASRKRRSRSAQAVVKKKPSAKSAIEFGLVELPLVSSSANSNNSKYLDPTCTISNSSF